LKDPRTDKGKVEGNRMRAAGLKAHSQS